MTKKAHLSTSTSETRASPQEMLIETTAWVQINMLASQVMTGTAQTDHGDRQVLAYINQLKRVRHQRT